MKTLIYRTHFQLILIFFLSFFALLPISHGATLLWDANDEGDLAGYKIYYGTSSGNYNSFIDVKNVTEYELCNLYLYEDLYFYIVITAYDTSGNESTFSTELDYFVDDGIPDDEDNCPDHYNPGQEANYPPQGNDIGDACDCEGDFYCDGSVDGADIDLFKADMGRNEWDRPCNTENPCNGDFDCNGSVDGGDVKLFKADMGRNPWDRPCPACVAGDWCEY